MPEMANITLLEQEVPLALRHIIPCLAVPIHRFHRINLVLDCLHLMHIIEWQAAHDALLRVASLYYWRLQKE